MEEKMDVVHESIVEVNLEESDSINLKELSQSIEEVIVTPDIYLFFTSPIDQGILNKENKNEYQSKINNDIYNEILHDKIEFLSTPNSSKMKASSLIFDDNTDVGTAQTLEVDTKSLPDDNYNQYFNNNLKMNSTAEAISSTKDKTKKVHFSKLISVGHELQLLPKAVDREHKHFSDLIQMYCYKCKTASMNYIDKKCHICQTSMLFQCRNCTCLYKKLIIVQNHIKYECYKERKFQCADCGYKSPSKIQLAKHIRNEHLNVVEPQKSFECLQCHRKYKIESNMLAHEKICSQGMTIQCRHCTFKTKFSRSLAIHMQMKHSELSIESQHQCPDCGKRYKYLKSLNRHIRSLCGEKLKFECDNCNYKSNRKYYLAKHMQEEHPQLFFKSKFM
ncbi:zinc finger protein 556-like isoform X1 [Nasonia vitripennis]|uniref:C2H2-type domain-containing protein n=1 Tax=Nasonia vitripennis TaxID=7425 RepID=A0A7M7QL14_NASVI|nr:zinc finger protein 556-like isoform X1 [Nasonia vitripennis]XP_031787179.1 zinc finger protein 556-like isoform X1 [Nasonia vitripennis]XP_031787180.1 zinc finger protein 556-like isoform X1 [Nasonia vitripennis]